MGSVIKKRRKRMSKKKHRKLLRKTRVQRRKLGKWRQRPAGVLREDPGRPLLFPVRPLTTRPADLVRGL